MRLHKFKPKRMKNTLFLKVTIAVSIVMTSLMVVFANYVVQQIIQAQEAQFVAPPPPPPKEPEKQQRQVMNKKKSRSSNAVKRINVVQTTRTMTPELAINLPSGLGGTGDGIGGMDIGAGIDSSLLANAKININLPPINLFGVQGVSDRILIAFDVSAPTMTDNMGGLDAFKVVKDEMLTLIKSLPPTVMFNVMAMDPTGRDQEVALFRPALTSANESAKSAFATWLATFNNTADPSLVGLRSHEGDDKTTVRFAPPPYNDIRTMQFDRDVEQTIWVVQKYKTYQAAIEQGAGLIYYLTSTWRAPTEYWQKLSDKEFADYKKRAEKYRSDWISAGKTIVDGETKGELYRLAREAGLRMLNEENARRRSSGKPLKVVDDTLGIAREAKDPNAVKADNSKSEDDLERDANRPYNSKIFKGYSQSQLLAAYEQVFKKTYDEKKLPRPTLNMILMLPNKGDDGISKAQQNAARSWANAHGGGRVRTLRGARPVSDFN